MQEVDKIVNGQKLFQKPEYQEYIRKTSAFFPMFPKK